MVSMFQSQLLGYVWKPRDDLKKKFFLGLSCVSVTNGPFIDGRTTGIEPARGGFTIHCLDPLGYIRPYPRTGFSLYLRSDSFLTPLWPLSKRSFFLYYNYSSSKSISCFLELGEAKLQTKRLGCSLHWFDFTLLKIKDRDRAGSEGSFSRQQAPLFEASPHQRKPLHASLLFV